MFTETESYSLKMSILKEDEDHFLAPETSLVISDNNLYSTPSPVGALMEIGSALASTDEKKEKGRRHRRHRDRKSTVAHWKMVAEVSSIVVSQLDEEILLLSKIIQRNGISIPSSSLLHPFYNSQKRVSPKKSPTSSGPDNLNCCPSYQATFKATVGTDVNGETVYLAGYNQHDDTLVQTFHAVRCFPHVVNKPCRFLPTTNGHQTATCVQKFSYTHAFTMDYENNDNDAGVQNSTQIRIPTGCQCEIPLQITSHTI